MPSEVLSAAVDNSASAAEWDRLLDAVGRDPALKEEWSRIWEWRDARDGVALHKAGAGFCAGVMAAVQLEAPPSAKVVDIISARPVAPVSAPVPAKAASLRWRSLIPLSAAAGMAAAVLLLGRPFDSAAPAPEAIAAAPVVRVADAGATWSAPERDDGATQPMDAASAEVLNSYLMEHSNTLAERSMGGSISNARFAVHTAGYPADGQ